MLRADEIVVARKAEAEQSVKIQNMQKVWESDKQDRSVFGERRRIWKNWKFFMELYFWFYAEWREKISLNVMCQQIHRLWLLYCLLLNLLLFYAVQIFYFLSEFICKPVEANILLYDFAIWQSHSYELYK